MSEIILPTVEKDIHTIEIVTPTATQEFNSIKSTIGEIPALLKDNYDILLPQDSNFQELLREDLNPELVDYPFLESIFVNDIYNSEDYQKGSDLLNSSKEAISRYFPILEKWEEDFGFKLFKEYNIVLTLYGPGGSFNSSTGVIIILVSKEGIPIRKDPIVSPLHEIVHIGIDKNIVIKNNLSHSEKENLVDMLCKEYLRIPNYQLQNYKNNELDKYVQDIDLKDLPKQIEKYKSKSQP